MLRPGSLKKFQNLFGSKFKNYLSATYDVFENKSLANEAAIPRVKNGKAVQAKAVFLINVLLESCSIFLGFSILLIL